MKKSYQLIRLVVALTFGFSYTFAQSSAASSTCVINFGAKKPPLVKKEYLNNNWTLINGKTATTKAIPNILVLTNGVVS